MNTMMQPLVAFMPLTMEDGTMSVWTPNGWVKVKLDDEGTTNGGELTTEQSSALYTLIQMINGEETGLISQEDQEKLDEIIIPIPLGVPDYSHPQILFKGPIRSLVSPVTTPGTPGFIVASAWLSDGTIVDYIPNYTSIIIEDFFYPAFPSPLYVDGSETEPTSLSPIYVDENTHINLTTEAQGSTSPITDFLNVIFNIEVVWYPVK